MSTQPPAPNQQAQTAQQTPTKVQEIEGLTGVVVSTLFPNFAPEVQTGLTLEQEIQSLVADLIGKLKKHPAVQAAQADAASTGA